MASFRAKALVLIIQLSLLLLSSSFTVLADEFDDIVSWVQLPQALPTQPPAEPPKPHKGGHHHHHHKQHAPTPEPVKPPTHPPSVKPPPPIKPPTHPPSVKPPPPVMPPTHPPSVKPPPPVKPPTHPPLVKPPPVKPPTHPPLVKPPPVKPPIPPPRKLFAVQGVVYCKSCKYAGIDTLLGASPLVGAVVKLECNNTKYRPVESTATTDKNGYFFLIPKNVTTAASHKCKVFLVSSPSKTCNVPTNLHAGSAGAILMPTPPPPPPKPPVPPPPYQIFTVGPFAFEPSKKVPCPR